MILWLTPDNKDTFAALRDREMVNRYVSRLNLVKPELRELAYIFAYFQAEGTVPPTADIPCPTDLECIQSKMEYVLHNGTYDRDVILAYFDNFLNARGLTLDLNMLVQPTMRGEIITNEDSSKVEDGKLYLPITALSIDSGVYTDRQDIKEVIFNENLGTIHASAFKNCHELTSVRCNSSLSYIGFLSFSGTGLASFTAPKSLRVIADNAFADCTGMRELSLNDGLLEIGNEAFQRCSALTAVSVPKSCIKLGDYAFSMCNLVRRYDLGAVETIGSYCFFRNRSIVELTLPESVSKLGAHAFDGCEELRCLHLPSSIPVLDREAFVGLPKDCQVYVHADAKGDSPITVALYLAKIPYEVVKNG